MQTSTRAGRWGRLWRLIKGRRRYFFLTIAATFLAALFAYLSPLVISFTVDCIVGGKAMNLPRWLQDGIDSLGGRAFLAANLWLPALAVLAAQGLNGLCAYLRGRWSALGGEGMAKALRDALYQRLVRAPYAWHKAASTGDLVQRCTSDVETVRRFMQMQLMEVARTILMALVAISIMLPIDPTLTLVACSLLPLLIVFSFFYSIGVQKQFLLVDEAEGALTTALQENLTGMRVVRAFARQSQELDKFTRLNRDYRGKALRLNNLMGVYWGASDMLGYLQIALVMLSGIYFAVQGKLSLGTVMLFFTYSSMLTFPMRQLGRILADLVKADVSLKRLDEILTAPQEEEPGQALTPPIQGGISFERVSFAYPDGGEVLHDVDFSVAPGQTVGILGSTGSGKSTLVHLLQRLYEPTQGRVLIDGVDTADIRRDWLRCHVGIVLQEPFLFSRTIGENIALGDPSASQEEQFDAARAACVHDVIESFGEGYDTMVGERGVTLSGGQKQRVAIARMLVQKTPICIFDDSLSAVDAETDAAIREALAKRDTGTTLLISHRVSTLRGADLILVLENGRIVQRGLHAELAAQEGLYRRVCAIQGELDEAPKGGDAL
ncbi:MAG: ABC transporter ATP-binding protein [Oscillospiraceae bacterium]|nr:ABC transporter ATP-binding protein [Oscillospiraceae bacterium]